MCTIINRNIIRSQLLHPASATTCISEMIAIFARAHWACNKLCGIFNSLVLVVLLPRLVLPGLKIRSSCFLGQKEKLYVLEFKFWCTFPRKCQCTEVSSFVVFNLLSILFSSVHCAQATSSPTFPLSTCHCHCTFSLQLQRLQLFWQFPDRALAVFA